MNNPAIQQTLVELEESLTTIDSAREQVSSVSEKGQQLVTAFSDILRTLEKVTGAIGIDEEMIKEKLDASFDGLKKELDSNSKSVVADSKELVNQLESIQKQFIDKLHGASVKMDEGLAIDKNDFSDKLDRSFASFNEQLSERSKAIETKSFDTIKIIEEESNKFTDHSRMLTSAVSDLESTIKEAEVRIMELDLVKDIKEVTDRISAVEELVKEENLRTQELSSKHNKQNLMLIGAGFLIVILLTIIL